MRSRAFALAALPSLLLAARPLGLVTEPEKTTFYLGRESIIASARPGMARWREAPQ